MAISTAIPRPLHGGVHERGPTPSSRTKFFGAPDRPPVLPSWPCRFDPGHPLHQIPVLRAGISCGPIHFGDSRDTDNVDKAHWTAPACQASGVGLVIQPAALVSSGNDPPPRGSLISPLRGESLVARTVFRCRGHVSAADRLGPRATTRHPLTPSEPRSALSSAHNCGTGVPRGSHERGEVSGATTAFDVTSVQASGPRTIMAKSWRPRARRTFRCLGRGAQGQWPHLTRRPAGVIALTNELGPDRDRFLLHRRRVHHLGDGHSSSPCMLFAAA